MQGFKSIDPKLIKENAMQLIGDRWMLVTAGTLGHTQNNKSWNTMTASWGGLGYLWNKCVAFVFVRPQRFTYEFTQANNTMTLSFFKETHQKALEFCGAHSGRNFNKEKETGLTPLATDSNSVTFNEAYLVFECKNLYSDMLQERSFLIDDIARKNYPTKDFHRMYVCEITTAWTK